MTGHDAQHLVLEIYQHSCHVRIATVLVVAQKTCQSLNHSLLCSAFLQKTFNNGRYISNKAQVDVG